MAGRAEHSRADPGRALRKLRHPPSLTGGERQRAAESGERCSVEQSSARTSRTSRMRSTPPCPLSHSVPLSKAAEVGFHESHLDRDGMDSTVHTQPGCVLFVLRKLCTNTFYISPNCTPRVQFRAQLCTISKNMHSFVRFSAELMNWSMDTQ